MFNLYKKIIVFIFILFYSLQIVAQDIKYVPNPTILNNSYEGFDQYTIVYNNKLYFEYKGDTYIQLAAYDGNTISLIPDPPGFYNAATDPFMTIFNGNLYLLYDAKTGSGTVQLAQYNGTTLQMIPNPDTSTLGINLQAKPIIFNSKLYFFYNNAITGAYQLANYDGTNINLIPNPDSSVLGIANFVNPVIYKDNLYFIYNTIANGDELVQFDGTNFKFIQNPPTTRYGGVSDITLYNDKLYISIQNLPSYSFQLGEYDGDILNAIANPDAGEGYKGSPIVYNNKLYISYNSGTVLSRQICMAQYDGTSLSLIPNPASIVLYEGDPVVFNNKLYYECSDASLIYYLGQYDGVSNIVLPNPDSSPTGYLNDYTQYSTPLTIVYNNNLFLRYRSFSYAPLVQYNGTTASFVANPTSGAAYVGSPIIYNNRLYFGYDSIASGNDIEHLAYLDTLSITPVTFLNFSALPKDNNAFLQWQTTKETNTNYFNIQRSEDGISFTTIGKVKAANISTQVLNYSYTDILLNTSPLPVIYYRLQEIDISGAITYSKIAAVTFKPGNLSIAVYPNPVNDAINIYSSADINDATINIKGVDGKLFYSSKEKLTVQGKLSIPVSSLTKGTYIIEIITTNGSNKFKIIK
jgi:hypothetical protein